MMGKKTKRLYDRMQHGIQQKQEAVQKLVSKREEVESKGGLKRQREKKDVGTEQVKTKKSKTADKK